MKKILAMILGLALAMGAFAGCNRDTVDTDGANATAGATTTTASTTTAPTDPTEPDVPDKKEPLDKSRAYRILFIGNSYTYYNTMPENIFANIAKSAGYTVTVMSITEGGHYLKEHANPNDTQGALVESRLENTKWDYVVLQEQSTCAIDDPASFYSGVRKLVEKIKANGATTILYETWGRKKGHEYLSEKLMTNEVMTWKLAAGYEAIGKELGIDVAYAGLAFRDVYSKHSDTIELYHNDKTHPSALGSHLAALTLFAEIFGSDLSDVTYSNTEYDKYADILKEAARKAVFETPEIPAEYKTSSEGVALETYGVDDSKMVNLKAFPSSPIISVITGGTYPNGKTFSGILGTKGKVASTEYSATGLTAAQKADIADIGYGVSVIGIEKMDSSAKGYETAVENLVNGHWGTSLMASFYFDNKMYDINGNATATGKYTGLITLNFGSKYKFDAMGFFSGSLQGFPGVAEVYVSDDGVNWKLVPTACWNNVSGTPLVNTGKAERDPWNGNTANYSSLFDMGDVEGQYIRIGVVIGRNDTADKYNTINTREIAVFGTKVE